MDEGGEELNFESAVEFVLEHEGEISNDPLGGMTVWGIAEKFHPDVNVTCLTRDGAKQLYRERYWDRVQCDKLPPAWRLFLFDSAVNTGSGNAVRFMQRALGVKADGRIGPQTLAAAEATNDDALRDAIAYRIMFYAQREGFATYGRGWIKRCLDLL